MNRREGESRPRQLAPADKAALAVIEKHLDEVYEYVGSLSPERRSVLAGAAWRTSEVTHGEEEN